MKNQYVGDINDFVKYTLLRRLSAKGLRIGICWMLTPDNQRGDGKHISYLQQPQKFRSLDPQLFDALRSIVYETKTRTVDLIEQSEFLRHARFHSEFVTRMPNEREAYFREMTKRFQRQDLVFFDPDNGLNVASVPYGATGAEKYVYADEWKVVAKNGKSVLIYQHFPRVKREVYTRMRMEQVGREANAAEVVSIASSRVLYLAISASRHQNAIRTACEEMAAVWKMQMLSVRRRAVRS